MFKINVRRSFVVQFFRKNGYSTLNTKPHLLIEEKKNYVIWRLNKPSTNSLNLEFLTELVNEIKKLEANDRIEGVILTSNLKNIFSSGLDLNELYEGKQERLVEVWKMFQDFWIRFYGSNKIFIGAINGHAPAGGCLLAMSCDYRIMARGDYSIGISATRIGIQPPFWVRDTMINTIGFRHAEKALQLGLLFNPEEALNIKLVDEVVEKDELISKAEDKIKEWLSIPISDDARKITKALIRESTLKKLIDSREKDTEFFIKSTLKSSVQEPLGKFLKALKQKKKQT